MGLPPVHGRDGRTQNPHRIRVPGESYSLVLTLHLLSKGDGQSFKITVTEVMDGG